MSLYGGITLSGQPDLENIRKLDLLPMPAIHDMMRAGMAIDRDHLHELTLEIDKEMVDLRKDICEYIPEEKLDEFVGRAAGINDQDPLDDDYLPMNVDSSEQLAKLLFDVLGVGEGQRLKLTKSGKRISTGKKQLERLKREHSIIQVILDYRERAKIKSTYTQPLPKKAVLHEKGLCGQCGMVHFSPSWRVHTDIVTTRTDTGRLASRNPNLQNITTRTELGRRVRAAFVASEGMQLVGADYSQIEMRLGGHYSLDPNLLRIFRNHLDPHTETAKLVFGVEKPDKLTQRDPCKNVNFGVFYGLMAPGLFDLIAATYGTAGLPMPDWLTIEWCENFIEQWFGIYEGVRGYLDQQEYRALRYGAVWSMFGRIRRVPEVKSTHDRIRAQGIRQAGNMPIQGTSADMIRLAIAAVQDQVVRPYRDEGVQISQVLTVHDEIILEVEEDYAESALAMMETVMAEIMRDEDTGEWMLEVPVEAEGAVMDQWKKAA